jgi:regulatory protein
MHKDYSLSELLEKVPDECKNVIRERLISSFPDLDEKVLESELRRSVVHGKGPLYLKNRLYERKINVDDNNTFDEDIWFESLKNAWEKITRKTSEKEKIIQYLLRQGFTYEMITKFLKEVDS